MTAAHVVNGMDEITVEGIAGEVVRATIISADAAADVSLLQLERVTAAMRVAPLGDSDTVRGRPTGHGRRRPYGLAYSMSVGWISARWPPNTIFRDMPLAEFLQTTATINTGNSGGPMFNMAGEVIGIVSQNISKSGGSEGLGFIVTINSAQEALGRPEGVLGRPPGHLTHRRPRGDLQRPCARRVPRQDGRPGFDGVEHGPAGGDRIVTIGGKEIPIGGDIILSVDDIPVVSEDNIEQIRTKLAGVPRGTPFKMNVLRAGKVLVLTGTTQGASR